MTIRWPAVGAAVAVLVAAAVVVIAPRVGRTLAFFRVRQVEVIGARYLDEADVAQQLRLRPGASTLDRLDPVRAAAAAIPGVLNATVERQLPNTLRVTLLEASPVALVALADHLALVDSAGRVLPFNPVKVPTSLPIASHDSITPGLLGRLLQVDPQLYAIIDAAHLDRGDVVLDLGSRRIRLRPGADASVLRSVSEVLRYLDRNPRPWREIDARYHSSLFVQKGAA